MHQSLQIRQRGSDYERAAPLLVDAFHAREATLGPDHPRAIDSLRELVSSYES